MNELDGVNYFVSVETLSYLSLQLWTSGPYVIVANLRERAVEQFLRPVFDVSGPLTLSAWMDGVDE